MRFDVFGYFSVFVFCLFFWMLLLLLNGFDSMVVFDYDLGQFQNVVSLQKVVFMFQKGGRSTPDGFWFE